MSRRSHGLVPLERAPGPRALLAITAAIVLGCAQAPMPNHPVVGLTSSIDSADLSRDLRAFAADSMRGRETGTSDANRAAQFIANRLGALGLEPVGDSMFFQRVPMVRQVVAPASRMLVTRRGVTEPLRLGDDVAPMLSLGEGQPEPRRTVDADVVFAGYAIASPTLVRDDFTGLDFEDRVVVFLHGAPPGVTGPLKDSLDSDAEMSRQLARVALRRPAAMVILMTGDATKAYRQLYPTLTRDVHGQLGPAPVIPGVEIPMIVFGLARRGSPLLPSSWPADDRAQLIQGIHLTAAIEVRREPFVGYNVIARVAGTDPVLRGSYVAFGAHYDHIGVLPPLNGDSIANGADDDGSGSMALLAIANAVIHHPMRRSALFVWHVGEEKGLLGSAYFTANPTVPLDSIVAQLNADMIGRNEPDKLYVIGPKAAPNGQSRRLGAIIDSVNARQPSPFPIDRSWDDANNPEQLYQRSDHYNYARHGIPIAFFTSGLHDDYHEVSDEADRIDYAKLARVSKLIFDIAQAVGNSVTRPR